MWARQQAWLSTPERKDAPSRAQDIERMGGEIQLPPLDEWEGAQDLAQALLEVGASEPGGMADVAISWVTLKAWSDLTGQHMEPGDYEALRQISSEFVTACHEYREKNVPAPYGVRAADPAKLQANLVRALDTLVSGNGKRNLRKAGRQTGAA